MAISKEDVLARLEQVYPDRIIYRERFCSKVLSLTLEFRIFDLAKEAGQTYVQWLRDHGFEWRETGYMEPDMCSADVTLDDQNTVAFCDSLLRRYPLIGQYCLTEAQRNRICHEAQNAVEKICNGSTSLSRAEQLVLTVATIDMLKNWSSDAENDSDKNTFWQFIYLQYGYQPENADVSEQVVYKQFCSAIRETLQHYHRFFSSEQTKRYYTSLLLHAIAPKQSIFSLFNVLLDFYARNLDYEYVPEDTSYKMFVKGIQARWNSENTQAPKLRSDAFMSGLKVLFQERPGYMAVQCDHLVQKMDQLFRGETFEPSDRWDQLLLDWYREKSSTERSQIRSEKRERRAEYVATSEDRIRLQYTMEQGQVGISAPRIRLSEVGSTRPELVLYQDGREIYRKAMSVTGDDLCLTTRRLFVPLEQTEAAFDAPMRLRGTVEYLGKTIYDSAEGLHRNYLTFDESGAERLNRSGILYLFADDGREITFAEDEGVYQMDHPGQLLRVNIAEAGAVMIDGAELITDAKHAGRIRIYPDCAPVQEVSVISEGTRYQIFQEAFSVRLYLPKDENPKGFQLSVDGVRYPIPAAAEEGSFSLWTPNTEPSRLHRISVVDIVRDVVITEFNYVILQHFSVTLEKPYYLETDAAVRLTISIGESSVMAVEQRAEESDTVLVLSPFGGADYEVTVPIIRCQISNLWSAFALSDQFWWEQFTKECFLHLKLPKEVTGSLMLGGRTLTPNANDVYELGNYLHSGIQFADSEPLWLYLQPASGEPERILLTHICFAPAFTEIPLRLCEEGLLWEGEHCFIGPDGAEFSVELIGEETQRLPVQSSTKLLCAANQLEQGVFQCRIYMKTGGLFSRSERLLEEGTLTVGDENAFRFRNQELVLLGTTFWDSRTGKMKTMQMQSTAGILEQLEFVGYSIPSGESVQLPEYEATLCFERWSDGRRIAFNYHEDSEGFEWVNPVRIWIISENRLILRCVTDDAVYFDTKYSSIVNRSPDQTMTKAEQRARLQTPDYFEYEAKDV